MKNARSAFPLLSALAIVVLSACQQPPSGTGQDSLYWHVLPDGVFSTNDPERAQKEIPFDLVLPTYFPGSGQPRLESIQGRLRESPRDRSKAGIAEALPADSTDAEVYIIYRQADLGASLEIRESEATDVTEYRPTGSDELITIEGIGVVKRGTYGQEMRRSQSITEAGIEYLWVRNSVEFNVHAWGYSAEESTRIVVSMIQ